MVYPSDLIAPLKNTLSNIKDKHFSPPKLPSEVIMKELFEVSYHASFLTEEGRKLHFRIIYASRDELEMNHGRTLVKTPASGSNNSHSMDGMSSEDSK